MTRRRPPELDGPEAPSELLYVWSWFVALHSGRQSTGFGPAALPWAEIESFFRMRGESPDVWELDLIRRLDVVALVALQPEPPAPARK